MRRCGSGGWAWRPGNAPGGPAGSCTDTAPSHRTAASGAEILQVRHVGRAGSCGQEFAPVYGLETPRRRRLAGVRCAPAARIRARGISRAPSDGQVRRVLLAVDRADAVRAAKRDQRRQRDLGSRRARRVNIDSPNTARPIATQYSPPASSPSIQVSTLCACRRVQGLIGLHHLRHDPGAGLALARRCAAQARITRVERACRSAPRSRVRANCASVLRSDRCSRKSRSAAPCAGRGSTTGSAGRR